MRPLLVKPPQNLAGSAYMLRTCRPSGDKRSHWLLKTRLRGEKMLGLAFETACQKYKRPNNKSPTKRALDNGNCPALTRLGWAMFEKIIGIELRL